MSATAPTASSSILGKMKAFSITHIISIIALIAEGLGFTALVTNLIVTTPGSNFGWLSIVMIAAIGGTTFYAVNFSANAQGIAMQTQPATPTPATPLGTVAQQTPEIQQLVSAVNALVSQQNKSTQQSQSQTPPPSTTG